MHRIGVPRSETAYAHTQNAPLKINDSDEVVIWHNYFYINQILILRALHFQWLRGCPRLWKFSTSYRNRQQTHTHTHNYILFVDRGALEITSTHRASMLYANVCVVKLIKVLSTYNFFPGRLFFHFAGSSLTVSVYFGNNFLPIFIFIQSREKNLEQFSDVVDIFFFFDWRQREKKVKFSMRKRIFFSALFCVNDLVLLIQWLLYSGSRHITRYSQLLTCNLWWKKRWKKAQCVDTFKYLMEIYLIALNGGNYARVVKIERDGREKIIYETTI